jgi:hypothetical protein
VADGRARTGCTRRNPPSRIAACGSPLDMMYSSETAASLAGGSLQARYSYRWLQRWRKQVEAKQSLEGLHAAPYSV